MASSVRPPRCPICSLSHNQRGEWMTAGDVMDALSISRTMLWDIPSERLPAYRLGGGFQPHRRYRVDDFHRFLEEAHHPIYMPEP